jgi:hypothetical protein
VIGDLAPDLNHVIQSGSQSACPDEAAFRITDVSDACLVCREVAGEI